MTESELLNEWEFKEKVVKWLMKYDISFFRFPGYSFEDYVEAYKLPDFDYIHHESFVDINGDVMTYLKGELSLNASASRSFEKEKLRFFHVLKTFIDSPEVEPYPMGYIIIGYY